ncbi:MAG: hypothetical protein HYS98_01935 [Deltaproteobacteria bacterium]|nr:hypothetical protein [Deltaproteobacteria bacterium]
MKKTTVYLQEDELKALKKKAFLMNRPIAELIRLGVKMVCQPSSEEEAKMLQSLENIRSKFLDLSQSDIEDLAQEAKKSVRSGKKKSHR